MKARGILVSVLIFISISVSSAYDGRVRKEIRLAGNKFNTSEKAATEQLNLRQNNSYTLGLRGGRWVFLK